MHFSSNSLDAIKRIENSTGFRIGEDSAYTLNWFAQAYMIIATIDAESQTQQNTTNQLLILQFAISRYSPLDTRKQFTNCQNIRAIDDHVYIANGSRVEM